MINTNRTGDPAFVISLEEVHRDIEPTFQLPPDFDPVNEHILLVDGCLIVGPKVIDEYSEFQCAEFLTLNWVPCEWFMDEIRAGRRPIVNKEPRIEPSDFLPSAGDK